MSYLPLSQLLARFPAATTLGDAAASLSVSAISAAGLAYDPVGLVYVRMRGDATNGLWVNVKTMPSVTVGSSALPTGAATEATLSTLNGKVTACNTGAVVVSSSALPTGASTDATLSAMSGKLPAALVSGRLSVDGSGVTQPVSGTVTANIGSSGSLALDATLTGGTLKAIARGGAKGATTAADLTGTAQGADHQAIDVQIYHGGTAKDPTAIRALTSADVVTAAQGTAAAAGLPWAVRQSDGSAFYTVAKTGQFPTALGNTNMAGSLSVTTASDDTNLSGLTAKFPSAATPADSDTLPSVTKISALARGYDGTNVKTLRIDLAGISAGTMATAAGVLQALPVGRYLSTRPALTDGQLTHVQLNSRGDQAVQEQYAPVAEDNTVGVIWGQTAATASATNAWTAYQSGSTKVGTAGVNIKASAGRLRRILGANTNATTNFWLILVNKASAPVANDVAVAAMPIPNISLATPFAAADMLDFGPDGKYLATGISYAISSTPEKVTLPATSDCVVYADYF